MRNSLSRHQVGNSEQSEDIKDGHIVPKLNWAQTFDILISAPIDTDHRLKHSIPDYSLWRKASKVQIGIRES